MAAYGVTIGNINTISPSARDCLTKVGKLEVADGSTGTALFGLPKGAFIAGVYTISMGANTTQTIGAGFSASGVELLSAYAPNSTGYAPSGAASGASVGTQLTADQVVYAKASATLTSPVYIKVEYWIPPQGLSF